MKKPKPGRRLEISKLRWHCDPRDLGLGTTRDVRPSNAIIGQPRALTALRLGLEIQSPGYNLFVTGLSGTGKTTAIKRLLQEMRIGGAPPKDLCYVHNFRKPDSPTALLFPAGTGRVFQRDMQAFMDHLRRALPELYESEAYQLRQSRLLEEFKKQRKSVLKRFDSRVQKQGFRVATIETEQVARVEVLPVVAGDPIPLEKLQELVERGRFKKEDFKRIRSKSEKLAIEMQTVLRNVRNIEAKMREALKALESEFGRLVVHEQIQDLCEKYKGTPGVTRYLSYTEQNLLESLGHFVHLHAEAEARDQGASLVFEQYQVNLVVDHSGATGPPIVIEEAPTSRNLFGCVERAGGRGGQPGHDFLRIRAGSMLAANGGFLVFNLADAMTEVSVWPTLKRVLKHMKSEVQSYDLSTGVSGTSIKPEPVDLRLKVVVIGDVYTYQLLHSQDEDFSKIFKVKADFDSSMRRNRASMRKYARFIANLAQTEKLMPLDAAAVAAVLEVSARVAGRQNKLTTRFSEIADVVREAHHWAGQDGSKLIRDFHVDRAVREQIERVNLVERKVQESFESGELLIDLRGGKIGQVNALTVYDLGDHVFGRPSRITSQVSLGRSGIINIEREANLSGSTHDKGVLILAGFLRGMYAQDKPLTLSASLAFEQSYGGVDGDSASAAELLALLSAIANLPLRQDLAISGSVNQNGEIQPIGSVNEKIEGFYEVCHARGLTGTQGVVIPAKNMGDLMLRKDIVSAVRKKRFHVYVADSVDQGIEIFTGIKAGRRRGRRYEHNTVHRLVDDALYELAEGIKEFVDGSDTPSGRPPQQGLRDEEEEEGVELRPVRSRHPGRRRSP